MGSSVADDVAAGRGLLIQRPGGLLRGGPNMKRFDREIRPIIILGAVIIVLALLSAWVFIFRPGSPGYFLRLYHEGFYLALFVQFAFHVIYLLIGVGVVSLSKWGYYPFKVFLYITLFAFPVGTIVSYLTLSYMKKHQIERYFGLPTRGEPPQPGSPLFSLPTTVVLIVLGIGLVALFLWVMFTF